MPVTRGTPGIPLDRFAATVETDRPLAEAPDRAPDEIDTAVAAHVAGLVEDGDTIQVGVGSLPAAVLDGLSGHRDLGFHSGMMTDGVLRLVDKGVITGRRKEIDAGLVVTGTAIGGADLYSRLGEIPVEFRPASYTHSARVLSRLGRLVSINSALEVDLTGQVGAEVAGGRYLGGIGGQADFSGAAARTGARSIIALRSTAGGASTIVAALRGPVTTARADVDVVVTEHGVAHLRGCPLSERAARLVAVAAPEHRDALLRATHGANG
jgi:acyl-CoA hydrolase